MYILLYILEFFIYQTIYTRKVFKKIDATLFYKHKFNKQDIPHSGDLNKLFYNVKFNNYKYGFGISGLKKTGEEFKFDIKTRRFFINTHTIYFLIKNIKMNKLCINKLIFGNFKIGYGQGLVFNFKYDNLFRPIDHIKIFRKQKGIKKCKSHKKNKFLGIGIEIKPSNQLDATFFTSKNYFDATTKGRYVLTAQTRESYTNIQNINKKNKIHNYSSGFGILLTPLKTLNLGTTFIYSKFNKAFKLINNSYVNNNKKQSIDGQPTGDENINVSIFSDFKYKKIKLYLEAAMSNNNTQILVDNGYACNLGSRVKINKYLKYINHLRIYTNKYLNFYGKGFGFGHGSTFKDLKGCISNEIGVYNGLQIKFSNKLISKFAVDLAYIPNETFYFTKAFIEYVYFEIIYKLMFFDYIKLQCKYNNTEHDVIKNSKEYETINEKCRIKFSVRKKIAKVLNKSDIFLTINPNEEKYNKLGYGMYEKISTTFKKVKLTFHFIAVNAIKNTPIYTVLNIPSDKILKLKMIDKKIIFVGISVSTNTKYLEINLTGIIKYNLENKKTDNNIRLSINYSKY